MYTKEELQQKIDEIEDMIRVTQILIDDASHLPLANKEFFVELETAKLRLEINQLQVIVLSDILDRME